MSETVVINGVTYNVGRGAFPVKRNGLRPYGYVVGKTLDGAPPLSEPDGEAEFFGVYAIQTRMTQMGFPILANGRFGPGSHAVSRQFQKAQGLSVDGRVGRQTCEELWIDLIQFIGAAHCKGLDGVPRAELLYGQTFLESAFDPGAVSRLWKPVNGPDIGLCQINRRWNPQVTEAQAYDPVFALDFSARRIGWALREYGDKGIDLAINCALAQHNNPQAAQEWYEVGWVGEDEWIWQYVQGVKHWVAEAPWLG